MRCAQRHGTDTSGRWRTARETAANKQHTKEQPDVITAWTNIIPTPVAPTTTAPAHQWHLLMKVSLTYAPRNHKSSRKLLLRTRDPKQPPPRLYGLHAVLWLINTVTVKVCLQHASRTEIRFANSSVNSCVGIHVFRTGWAPTDLLHDVYTNPA